jgi:hypothetical protein
MTRRSRGSGKQAKTRRRKAEMPKRGNAPIAGGRTHSVADLQARLDRQTHELIEGRELQAATAEVLRVISISPNDTQPVFDTIVSADASEASWRGHGCSTRNFAARRRANPGRASGSRLWPIGS